MAKSDISTFRWFQGLIIASIFSVVYFASPAYIISSILVLLFQFPNGKYALIYATPLLLSIATPSKAMPWLANYMKPMLDYFDYEEVLEFTNEEAIKSANNGKKFIIGMQPHGVISFVSLCAWTNAPPEVRDVPTAVASVLLSTPILKNVMGIYGLTPASGSNVKRILQKGVGIKGCIVIYIGGIAELFKTCPKEERLYLKNRKGFVKIALREGVDIVPVYLFGNTSVLNVLKNKFLANVSRKMQMSVTYFWGKWLLPIPRDDKLIYVRGKPLGLPHIPEPTDEDINKWHAKYCEEVTRLFEMNKEKLPAYKHKKLFID